MIRPEIQELVVGQSVAIQLVLEPPVPIAEANWSFVTGGGELDPETGEAVAFTAPETPDTVIIQVNGATEEGVPFEVITTFQVVAPTPTAAPPRPARTACSNFTADPNERTSLPASDIIGEIAQPVHCATDIPAGEAVAVGGSAQNVPDDAYLWLLVYASDGRYYPQCDNALEGNCGANYSRGVWNVTTFMGTSGCKEHFHLVLADADSAGDDYLTQEVQGWAESGEFAGLTTGDLLQYEITEIDAVEVETAGETCP
jgi:hypothetical protein